MQRWHCIYIQILDTIIYVNKRLKYILTVLMMRKECVIGDSLSLYDVVFQAVTHEPTSFFNVYK